MKWPPPRTLISVAVAGVTAGCVAFVWLLAGWTDRGQVAAGRVLYAEYCAICHGATLEGRPDWQIPLPSGRMPAPPHDATGHTWHHADSELFAITKHGMGALLPDYESDMPAFAEAFSDNQIRAVLVYIRSTWPSRERDYQAARTKAHP